MAQKRKNKEKNLKKHQVAQKKWSRQEETVHLAIAKMWLQ